MIDSNQPSEELGTYSFESDVNSEIDQSTVSNPGGKIPPSPPPHQKIEVQVLKKGIFFSLIFRRESKKKSPNGKISEVSPCEKFWKIFYTAVKCREKSQDDWNFFIRLNL